MTEVGRKQAQEFVTTTAKIQDLIDATNPLCLMASMAFYGLIVGIRDDGSIVSIVGSNKREILPAHVELAQALCLRVPAHSHSHMPVLGKSMQSVFDTVGDWSDQFHWKRLVQLDTALSEAERDRLLVQEHIRLDTQIVRNWGYYDHVKRIAQEIMAPLDARFEALYGFKATELLAMFDHLVHECEIRLNAHWERLRGMIKATTLRHAVVAYYTAFPDLKNNVQDFHAHLRARRVNLMQAKTMMLSHSDLRLPAIFTFSPAHIAAAIGRTADTVIRALGKLSLSFGDLQGTNVEHFFMNNPVWTKPVVKLEDRSYFCIMPRSFFAFPFETFTTLVREDEALRKAYENRRSDYLEQTSAKVFEAAFPGAKLIKNFKGYTPDKKQIESDLIVQVDSFLILMEAKSGRISPAARRGAPESLGEDIDKLLIEPSRQSQRLQKAIESAQRGEAETEAFAEAFPVNLSTIHQVLRLSVTLEYMGVLQTNINGLRTAGYVPPDIKVAPALTLADLEIVFDILRTSPERIHYLIRRGEWEGSADYTANEIDLLGTYLKTGLNVGDLEFAHAHLMLVGQSKSIDDYYEARQLGISKERPQYQATPWWRDMLQRLRTKRPHRWIEAAAVLLCAGLEQQMEIENRTKGVIADVKKRRERAASRNGLIFRPAKGRSEAIAVLALMRTEIPDRRQLMENLTAQAFSENAALRQCVAITLNVDEPTYPYRSLAWFTKPAKKNVPTLT